MLMYLHAYVMVKVKGADYVSGNLHLIGPRPCGE